MIPTDRDETPLESWKEIASYLQRDPKTVRRWEKHEGLPVHRHQHRARSTVYAYPSELDAWRANRTQEASGGGIRGRLPWRPLPAFASTIALALIVLLSGSGPQVGTMNAQSADGPGLTMRRVWAGPEAEVPGFPSPDGRYFTFDGGAALDQETGEFRSLSEEGGWNQLISPDGQQIVYGYGEYGEYELRIRDFDGSNVRILVPVNEEIREVRAVAWSSNQEHILALISRQDGPDIAFVTVADGSIRVLKSLPARTQGSSVSRAVWPSLSPDGRYVVYDLYSCEDCEEHDIYLLSADGSVDTTLIEHPADDFRPVWTPDGTRVLFASNRDGDWGFWTVAVAEGTPHGAPERIKSDIGDIRWSRGFDAEGAFYYVTNAGREDIYVGQLDPNTGMITGQPSPVASRFAGTNIAPTWSPDGEYLAYLSQRGSPARFQLGSVVIVIRSVKTGEERDLATGLLPMFGPLQWFPDSRSLLVGGYRGNRLDGTDTLYRVDVETGAVRAIRQIRPSALDPTPSPDGRVVYYWQMENDGGPILIAHQIESGEEQELYTAAGSWRAVVAVSPNGRQLAIAHSDGESESTVLKVMPASGGDARLLVRTEPTENIHYGSRLEWTRDGRYLIVARLSEEEQDLHTDPSALWRVSVEDGELQRIGPTMERIRFPSLHPDGRQIAFDSGTERVRWLEVWAMENFLPEPVSDE